MSSAKTFWLPITLWLLSLGCFALGMYWPIMATKTSVSFLVLDYQSMRIVDTVMLFWESSDYFLALLIFVFAMLLPLLKYADLLGRIVPSVRKVLRQVPHLPDKWSMLDVFLVAVLIVNFKVSTSFISVEVGPGVTWFAASIVFRMALGHLLDTLVAVKNA
jgi:uncharacterized paraquat-inducible protein A